MGITLNVCPALSQDVTAHLDAVTAAGLVTRTAKDTHSALPVLHVTESEIILCNIGMPNNMDWLNNTAIAELNVISE